MKLIESITIRYFRSVYTLTLKDCKDLTILTGKNDVGKSNILKAINLFFNNQSDHSHYFNFTEDYSILRKEEVKKDTIRGQQFISIDIRFIRGDRMTNSLPPIFNVIRRWDMHSSTPKTTSDVQKRMKAYAKKNGLRYSEKTTSTSLSTFLNKIKFIYIPAIKDDYVFSRTLDLLQRNLFDKEHMPILDSSIDEANKAVQKYVGDIQNDFKKATDIVNFIELPKTLNYIYGLLEINTKIGSETIALNKRGDGIKSHYIPKILKYITKNSRDIYIWGFEEPENSYEYRRCLQVANEFDTEYSNIAQIFLTSHSPAFFGSESKSKIVFRIGNENGKTCSISNESPLDEELGYVELYKNFINHVKDLQRSNIEKEETISELKKSLNVTPCPVLLTEGKTDADLLELAISKLKLTAFKDWEIRAIQHNGGSGSDVLLRCLSDFIHNFSPNSLIIGMFDRDVPLKFDIGQQHIDIRNKEYVKLADKVYAFAIPVPHNRKEADQISIEHYFTDDEIKTELEGKRLFFYNEFYETGCHRNNNDLFYKSINNSPNTIKIIEHESKRYVTKKDGTGDFSISKSCFVSSIQQNKEGFDKISFSEFQKIFDILDKIQKDSSN